MHADDAVDVLMREAGDRLLRLAYQLCRVRARAEDLVQEAVLRVYSSWLRRMPDVGSAEAYVRRAVADVRSDSSSSFEADVVERDRLWTALGAVQGSAGVAVLRGPARSGDRARARLPGRDGPQPFRARPRSPAQLGTHRGDTMIEDELRAVMRAHADDAPRAADVTIRAPRRRSPTWAVAAAVVVMLAVAAGIFALRHTDRTPAASPTALTCPEQAGPDLDWVPAHPSGIDGSVRLTPMRRRLQSSCVRSTTGNANSAARASSPAILLW